MVLMTGIAPVVIDANIKAPHYVLPAQYSAAVSPAVLLAPTSASTRNPCSP